MHSSNFEISHPAIEKKFKVGLFSLPKNIDSSVINTVTDFVILNHLARPLVNYYVYGELQGDIAQSWKIENDFTRYIFKIKENQKFSDGSTITAEDVQFSLMRTIKFKGIVHYNISKIKSVEVLDQYKIAVNLNKSDPFFLMDIGNPEFGILSKADQLANLNEQKFKVTSGPYSILQKDQTAIVLQFNTYFNFNSESPKTLYITEIKNSDVSLIMNSSVAQIPYDIFWSSSNSIDLHKHLVNLDFKILNPRLGFSYWITLNPKSKRLKSIKNRKVIQSILNPIDLYEENNDPFRDQALQLYFPKGPGRLEDDYVNNFWKISKTHINIFDQEKMLTFLCHDKFIFLEKTKKILQRNGFVLNVITYNNFVEYEKLIKKSEKYDLIQVNNDFSDLDLRGNINLTFNEHRPLMLLAKDDIKSLNQLNEIGSVADEEKRNLIIKEFGKSLLENAYYVPMYYTNTVLYLKPFHEVSEWSHIGFDISFWKIHPWKF